MTTAVEVINRQIHGIDVSISKSKRRTLMIRVSDGKVQAFMPKRLSESHIEEFVAKKLRWIQRKIQQQLSVPSYIPKRYLNGEVFYYLGQPYTLRVIQGSPASVSKNYDQIVVVTRRTEQHANYANTVHRQLRQWYWQAAEQELQARTDYYAERMQLKYSSLIVRQYKSRWGSCSAKGEISYNWQILLAPLAIVDYLVVHELAHLKQHNHSPRFWALVATQIPDYKARRQWLKEQGGRLRID